MLFGQISLKIDLVRNDQTEASLWMKIKHFGLSETVGGYKVPADRHSVWDPDFCGVWRP